MLTTEAPQFTIDGVTLFRDHADPRTIWYLPKPKVRVADGGRGLSFVAYSEDISSDPNFEAGSDRAGGFLTLEVELEQPDLEALRSEIGSQAGVSDPVLAQVPFTDGDVRLFVLGSAGSAQGNGEADGFKVQTAGSSKCSLFGVQTAVFSVRLGGKAAEILFNTLRETRDPQAVVAYDLKFKALEPAYNLEVEVDFKRTFEHMRHRVGVNLLVAKADLDFMIQEAVNEGSIVVRETDFTGNPSGATPISAEGGVLRLVRDLISPTLFNPMPIPTPDYRALPDSATSALNGDSASSTTSIKTLSSSTGTKVAREITVGSDIKIKHTPVAGGQNAGAEIPVSAKIELADGVTDLSVKLHFREQGKDNYLVRPMTVGGGNRGGNGSEGGNPTGGNPSGNNPSGANPTGGNPSGNNPSGGNPTGGNPSGNNPSGANPSGGNPSGGNPSGGNPSGGNSPGGANPGSGANPGGSNPSAGVEPSVFVGARSLSAAAVTDPLTAAEDFAQADANPTPSVATESNTTHSAKIPGQSLGTVIEYYIEAKAKKGGETITQTIPKADPKTKPLSFRVGKDEDGRTRTFQGVADLQTNTLVGYSLRSIDVTEQVKRTFKLNKQMATTRSYHPGGVLSADGIGPNFDPDEQITHVRLGEGPFKVIVLKFRAGFDFDAQHILAATVHIEYGSRTGSSEPLHAASIRLTKDQLQGQVQFFADDQGSQSYRYSVEFVYDPEHLVGDVDPQSGIRSPVFENETRRDITVDLERHSPVIPVTLRAGHLDFDAQVLRQVQVRVAPSAGTEGRTVKLDSPNQSGQVNVMPAPGRDGYFMSQKFFFRDDSTEIEIEDARDSEVFVNEPDGVVFRIRPQFVDPFGLVERMLADVTYRHADGEEERATLQLDSQRPSSESAIVLREDDPESWSAVYRFVMKDGPPLTGPRLDFAIAQPFANLTTAGFRVVRVDLLDPAVFAANDVLAVRAVLGADPDDPSQPSATVMLRQGTTTSSVVVPGVGLSDPVQARIDVIRRGVAPERSNASLSGSENNLFLFF